MEYIKRSAVAIPLKDEYPCKNKYWLRKESRKFTAEKKSLKDYSKNCGGATNLLKVTALLSSSFWVKVPFGFIINCEKFKVPDYVREFFPQF